MSPLAEVAVTWLVIQLLFLFFCWVDGFRCPGSPTMVVGIIIFLPWIVVGIAFLVALGFSLCIAQKVKEWRTEN